MPESGATYSRTYRAKHPERVKEQGARQRALYGARWREDRRVRRRALKQELVDAFGGHCEVCGYDRSLSALDFDHLDPAQKLRGVGEFITLLDRDGAFREAEKCQLLCANCHREKTWGQGY